MRPGRSDPDDDYHTRLSNRLLAKVFFGGHRAIMNTPATWTLRDYFALVNRFKWRAAAFFVLSMLLAVLYLALAPRRYASQSKLFVRVGRENAALDPTLTKGETLAVNASREEEMNSIVEHLRSRYILERTLAKLDPDAAQADPESREKALLVLGDSLYVDSPRSSTVVNIQGRAATPEQAQKMVATMVDVYLEEHMRISLSPASYEFLAEQSKRLDDQLEAAQSRLRDAKNRAGIASIDDRRTAIEGQINAVETQIHQVDAALDASGAKLGSLKASVRSLPEPLLKQMVGGMPNDGLAAMRGQLYQLQVQEEQVRSKYTGLHPVAVAVHEQVQEAAGTLNREEPDRPHLVTAITAQEAANQAALAAEKQNLQNGLALLQRRLATLNDDEIGIAKLTRNVRQIETQYLACAENKEEARIDQALRMERLSNISIIQPATLEVLPVRPRKGLTLFLAALGGGLGAICVALASAQWQPRVVRGSVRPRPAAAGDLNPWPAPTS